MLERLVLYQDWLHVDTEAGVAYRKVSGEYRRTGTVDAHGYVVCNRLRKLYKVHRVVAELVGMDVSNDIDHINGVRTDNRACNLRPALRGYNNANSHKGRDKLYSTTKGVSYDKARAKWMGHVTIHGDTHQRRFSTEQEAVDWVVCKRKELHGDYAKA